MSGSRLGLRLKGLVHIDGNKVRDIGLPTYRPTFSLAYTARQADRLQTDGQTTYAGITRPIEYPRRG